MGNNAVCCEATVPVFTLSLFKEQLEGSRKKMKEEKPEVWVTLKEIVLKDDAQSSFSPAKFQLQGITVEAEVSITGSNLQIVQEMGSETALKLMDKVGVSASTKRVGSEFNGKLPSGNNQKVAGSTSLIEARERPVEGPERVAVGSGGWEKGEEEKVFDVKAMFTMTKELGEDEVNVHVRDLESGVNGMRTSIQSETIRKHIEGALTKRAGEIVAQQVKDRGFRLPTSK